MQRKRPHAGSVARREFGGEQGSQERSEAMANINVERKDPGVWPWVVGLLVLAILVWAFVELLNDRVLEPTPPDPIVDSAVAGPAARMPSLLAPLPAITDPVSEAADRDRSTDPRAQRRDVTGAPLSG